MSVQGMDQLLGTLQSMATQAANVSVKTPEATQGPSDFASLLQSSIAQVNEAQQQAQSLQNQFNEGSSDVGLQDVVLSLQKANLSFQTMVQVRNKLVTAYQEMMNMQV